MRRVSLEGLVRSAAPALALGLVTSLLLQGIARLPPGLPESVDTSLAGRVTWSFIVCVSMGLAMVVARRRFAVVAAGLVGAPLAFILARAARRASVSFVHAVEGDGPSPALLAAIKGVEYGCLGFALSWVARRREAHAATYAAVGLATGLVFGVANLLITNAASTTSLTLPTFLAWLVNEVFFPTGCALVIWTVDRRALAIREPFVTGEAGG